MFEIVLKNECVFPLIRYFRYCIGTCKILEPLTHYDMVLSILLLDHVAHVLSYARHSMQKCKKNVPLKRSSWELGITSIFWHFYIKVARAKFKKKWWFYMETRNNNHAITHSDITLGPTYLFIYFLLLHNVQ